MTGTRCRFYQKYGMDASLRLLNHVSRYPVLILGLVLFSALPVHLCNRELFLFFNGLHSLVTDQFWLAATTVGDGMLLVIIVGAFLVVNPRVTVMGLVLLLLASLAVNGIKLLVPTLRPASVLDTVHVVGPLLRSGSFPSGHTASSMVAGLTIAAFAPSRSIRVAAVGGALLVSISRIFVGAHFPRDVMGGIILALVLLLLARPLLSTRLYSTIPSRPVFSSRLFTCALGLEIAGCLFSIGYYAFHFAEYPPVACAVGLGCLAVVGVGIARSYRFQRPCA